MNDDISGFTQHCRCVGSHRNAPRCIGAAYDIAQILSRLGRIRIDSSDNFDGFFFPHQPHNRGPDRTDAILHGMNFLFHYDLRRARRAFLSTTTFSPASQTAVTSFANRVLEAREEIWSEYDKAITRRVQPDSYAQSSLARRLRESADSATLGKMSRLIPISLSDSSVLSTNSSHWNDRICHYLGPQATILRHVLRRDS